MRNEQTMEALHEEEQLRFCLWMHNNRKDTNWKCVKAMSRPFEVQEGEQLQEDTKLHCVGVQQLVEPRKMSA